MGNVASSFWRLMIGGGTTDAKGFGTTEGRGRGQGGRVLIVFATETGVAEELAYESAERLQKAGLEARTLGMDELALETLQSTPRVLFIVSTTGMGDPPDMAFEFSEESMEEPAELAGLECAVLALGDSSYPQFAGFGRRLHQWLADSGARFLFPLIVVDDSDPEALDAWRARLDQLARESLATPATDA